MKKIFLITLFLILSFLFSFTANSKENSIKEQKNTYYYGNISPCFYDLSTFKYNPIKKTFSINIFYELNAWHDSYSDIKSPNDENDIVYLIFATNYSLKNNKLNIKYRGFVSAKYIEDKTKQSGYKLSEIKIYYDNKHKYIPKLQESIEDLKRWLSGGNELTYNTYNEDVTKNIFNAYKNGSWEDLKYLKNSLEEF